MLSLASEQSYCTRRVSAQRETGLQVRCHTLGWTLNILHWASMELGVARKGTLQSTDTVVWPRVDSCLHRTLLLWNWSFTLKTMDPLRRLSPDAQFGGLTLDVADRWEPDQAGHCLLLLDMF